MEILRCYRLLYLQVIVHRVLCSIALFQLFEVPTDFNSAEQDTSGRHRLAFRNAPSRLTWRCVCFFLGRQKMEADSVHVRCAVFFSLELFLRGVLNLCIAHRLCAKELSSATSELN